MLLLWVMENTLSSGLRLSIDGWVNLCVPAFHHCLTEQFSAGPLPSVFPLRISFSLLAEGRRSEGEPRAGVLSKRCLPGRLMTLHLVWISRRILHVAVFPAEWLLGLYALHLKEECGCFFPAGCAFWLIPALWWQWSWPVLEAIKITFSFPSCVIIWQRWWCILSPCVCKHCSHKNNTCYNRAAAETCCCFDDLPCKYIIWAAASSHESHWGVGFKSFVLKEWFFPSH